MSKPIHENSFKYILIRSFVDFYFHIFFKKVVAVGKENIPKGEPVLFAVNHQCSLMDAFAVIFTLRNKQVFMARADIFKKPGVAKFLRFIKILPIFRMRDGIQNLSNNDGPFNEAVGTLMAKERLVILPEGSHFGQKRLRSLKKGLARIAFQAEEKSDFKLNIKVIPVGLDFSDYIKFGSRVLVQYGEPFTLESYFDEYNEQPQRAMNRFMGDLRQKMIPNMLHIDDTENYDSIKDCCDLYTDSLKSTQNLTHLEERLNAQKVVDVLSDLKTTNENEFTKITNKSTQIKQDLKDLNLRAWVLNKPSFNMGMVLVNRLLQFMLFPIFLIGYAANALPFTLPVLLTKKIKDPMFLSSIRVSSGAIIFTLYYLILTIVLLIALNPSMLAFVYIGIFIVCGLMSNPYYRWFVKTSAKVRHNKYRRKQNSTWVEVMKEYAVVVDKINRIL